MEAPISSEPMYFEVGEPVACIRKTVSWEFSIDDFVNRKTNQRENAMETVDTAIEILCGMIVKDIEPDKALTYSRAALNLAQVKGMLTAEKKERERIS